MPSAGYAIPRGGAHPCSAPAECGFGAGWRSCATPTLPRLRSSGGGARSSQEAFRELCDQAGGISSPAQLLNYLSNAGVVFYRQGLFDDQIILDQAWALDAIYAAFDRELCYRQLMWTRGRFTRALLESLVWQRLRRRGAESVPRA